MATNQYHGGYMEYLYETHMHTSEVSACADSTAAQQVHFYKKRGYTGVIITDHFVNGHTTCPPDISWDEKMHHFVTGYNEAKQAGKRCGLDVFFGWEYSLGGSDFLTYGLDLDFLLNNPNMDKMHIEDYSTLVRSSGGYLAQAHPFREAWYIENTTPVDHYLIDGVEVYNAMESRKNNIKAMEFAKRYNLPEQAGSDSHTVRFPHSSGIKLYSKAETIQDIIRAIKNKEVTIVR